MCNSEEISKEFKLIDRYWKASNYLAVGQIYLLDKNPLLKKPLILDHVKKRLLGHFGTTSGQNFIYVHLNRLIKERKLSAIYVAGPGHGGPAIVAQVYLEGTYTESYPGVTRDEEGIGKLFKQFSFPGGIPSHVAPETPGSIHEGGELGYSLSHSFGAVLDKPDLTVFCVVGDGEAETGPLATSWHSNKFLNPITDGVVLLILHLNGFKIANPSVLSRIPMEELKALMTGYGYEPILVEGSSPAHMHPAFAAALNLCADKTKTIKENALLEQQQGKRLSRPTWPMIILKSPKGWTGPRTVDGVQIEGTFRSHQVPLSAPADNPDHLALLEKWLKSYEPEQQFDSNGRLVPELQALAPPPHLCMGNNRFTNPVIKPLVLPNFEAYAVNIDSNGRGETLASNTYTVGTFLRDVIEKNQHHRNFRMFGPDETKSNKLHAIYEVTDKQWMGESSEDDVNISTDGRMMEMLSEHQCEGWLEGYLLTGGHGLFNSYEAFIHIISSMFNQHAKWLETTKKIPWRNALSSLNILLSSHAWRQDHNGFTHQDPGFLSHAMTKKPEITRIYLPPDANCLLSVMHHCLQSRHYCNVMVAGKQQSPQWLSEEEAAQHCKEGLGIWEWASSDVGVEPDIILACAGDVPTIEVLAATTILRDKLPRLHVRFVNVVDLMKLYTPDHHPHGLPNNTFDSIFTRDKPVLFNFHAYPQMIEKLVYDPNNRNFVVRGYREEGTITTPFDMCVFNGIDRYNLVIDTCDLIETKCPTVDNKTRWTATYVRQEMKKLLQKHKKHIYEYGLDMEEVANWKWMA